MIDTIYKILDDVNSFYYSYCMESNTIVKIKGYDNSSDIRDLINITNKLIESNIEFTVTEQKNIILKNNNL